MSAKELAEKLDKIGYDEVARKAMLKHIAEWFQDNYGGKKVELNAASILKEYERQIYPNEQLRDYRLLLLLKVMKESHLRIYYGGLANVLRYPTSERGYPFPDILKAALENSTTEQGGKGEG